MTATDPAPLVCPQCGTTNTALGGSGNGMCFECAHVWDPAQVVALPRAAVAPFAMAPVDEVFGPTAADVAAHPAGGAADRTDWFDAPVTPTGPPDPHDFPETWSGLAQYRAVGGSMSNEQWWSDIMGAPPDDLDPVTPADDQPPAEVGAVMMIAAQILEAGITAAYVMSVPGATLVPRTGYLPDDPDLLGIIEQACAVAVGMLCERAEIDPARAAGLFGIELEQTTQGDPTTEVAHVEGSGEAE